MHEEHTTWEPDCPECAHKAAAGEFWLDTVAPERRRREREETRRMVAHRHPGAYSSRCPQCRRWERQTDWLKVHAHFGAYSPSCPECRRWERGLISDVERDDRAFRVAVLAMFWHFWHWTPLGQLYYWIIALGLTASGS